MNMPIFVHRLLTMCIEDLVAMSQDPQADANTVRLTSGMVAIKSGAKSKELIAKLAKAEIKDIKAPDVDEFLKMLETLWALGKGFITK